MPLSPTAMMLLNRAEKIFHLEEWLVRVVFEKNAVEKNSKPMTLKYVNFMPREKEEYLSFVNKAEEITDENIVDIARTHINRGPKSPKFLAKFQIKILNTLMESNSVIDMTVNRDNDGYPYHTSVGKLPEQEELQRAIATWIKSQAICVDIKPVIAMA